MWVRKKIDIRFDQLLIGLWNSLKVGTRAQEFEKLNQLWAGPRETFACLSVRSGFDVLLSAMQVPAASEIVMSGLTIADMPRIVRHHELIPVPVDVDAKTVSPDLESLRASITPRTRAIVVAHLFGGLCDLEPIAEIAREHKLLLIEDCAQAYVGQNYLGSDLADVSMFSFGPIKTNTSLGGALLTVRNRELKDRMEAVQRTLPRQPQMDYFKRTAKYIFIRSISCRFFAGLIRLAFKLTGNNHDKAVSKMAKGFAGPDFFERIRQQPPLALTKMLVRRLRNFDPQSIKRRIELADLFRKSMNQGRDVPVEVLGSQAIRPTYWVLPILVSNPDEVVQALWDHGFDATRTSSLEVISEIRKSDPNVDTQSDQILRHIVFIPFAETMPEYAVEKMANLVNTVANPATLSPPKKRLRHNKQHRLFVDGNN